MPAIPRRHFYALEASLSALGEKWTRFHNVGFTHDEFLSLFAPPEHHQMLKEVAEIAHVDAAGGYHRAEFKHEKLQAALGSGRVWVDFYMNLVNGTAPLMPRNTVILPTANPETLERLADWVIERAEINFGISRARAVLSWLSVNCTTANEIRFLWPTLVALCSLREDTVDYGHKLREVRPPKSLPMIPPEVKAGLKASAGTVASAMLLGDPKPFSAPVTVSLANGNWARHEGALGWIAGS